MTRRPEPALENEPLHLQAAGWYARKRAGDMSAADIAALNAWLADDPAHLEAFERLERTWSGVESARGDPRIMIMRERALKRGVGRPRALAMRAVAASLAVAVVVAAVLTLAPLMGLTGYGSLATQTYRTGVGQQATVTLSDGSVVTLNTDTRLRTHAAKGRRLVHLDRGQAFFRVAKDPLHPFIVTAAGRTVTALGTAFDVRVDQKTFEVTVVEGKVRVEAPPPPIELPSAGGPKRKPPPQPADLGAGVQLVATLDAPSWTVARTDTAREVSWLRGYVVFQKARFADVVAEMNRYSDKKLVVDDPALAAVSISGAFRAGDQEAFVKAYEDYRVARVESR
ncbi:MAG TPA: FecR domain-containing protein, partial [Caulobacteraceae bacterium]|nr:FecR domain-containing protein [Caulobacteraceae bacterium]